MKYFLITAMLLFAGGTALSQEDVQAKHAAYYLCANNIEKDPSKAYEYCSDYLNKYPNDDPKLIEFAGKFVAAYRKISHYLESVPLNYFAEITPGWAVYRPQSPASIPAESSLDPKYPILIKREYGSPEEERLLAKAESVYKNPQVSADQLRKQWRSIAAPEFVLPDGEPKWWTGKVDAIQSTELVTTEAVLYYYYLSHAFRTNGGKSPDKSFTFLTSSLKYESSIKKMDAYERAGKSFKDVYVANMTLTWSQICGSLCGYGFTRNKTVILSPSGEIVEMFLDDPVNSSSWFS